MAGMEKFTQRAKRVLSIALKEAEAMNQATVGTEHVLLGLISEDGGIANRVLSDLGLEVERVREITLRLSPVSNEKPERIELSQGTQRVLEYSIEEATQMGHHYIGTEHLLLALLRSDEGLAPEVLKKLGVTSEQIRRQTRRVLTESTSTPARQQAAPRQPAAEKEKDKGKTPLVDQLATDLTAKAEEGKLIPSSGVCLKLNA